VEVDDTPVSLEADAYTIGCTSSTRPTPPSHEVELPRGLSVLVADDLAYNREVAAKIFRRFSWHVSEAESAEQVLERLLDSGEQYDILLTDEAFGPDCMLGSEAIRQLRSKLRTQEGRPPLFIISCTGFVDQGVMAGKEPELLQAGADVVWAKPLPDWSDGTMQRQLTAHLGDRRRPHEATASDDAAAVGLGPPGGKASSGPPGGEASSGSPGGSGSPDGPGSPGGEASSGSPGGEASSLKTEVVVARKITAAPPAAARDAQSADSTSSQRRQQRTARKQQLGELMSALPQLDRLDCKTLLSMDPAALTELLAPYRSVAAASSSAAGEAATSSQGKATKTKDCLPRDLRAIIVDDVKVNRMLLSRIFIRRFGWTVVEAATAEELLERMLQRGEDYGDLCAF
jgi:CheY-like chemotaxis protein